MGTLIEVARPDGKTCPAYEAAPVRDGAPGLVVIQEWWGLNDQIKSVADAFAADGFHTVVPDLFRGKLTTEKDEASHLMGSLDFADAAGQDVRGVAQYLRASGASQVGVMGFCMGGALTILSGLLVPEMNAGVCYYGIPPLDQVDPSKITAPLLLHFATEDDWCTPALVDQLEERLKAGAVPYTLHRYEGKQHAFMNERRPEVHDPEAASTAKARTLEFLRRHLT